MKTSFLLALFLLAILFFVQPAVAQVNHALAGVPSYTLVNDVPYPFGGSHFWYNSNLSDIGRLNDDSTVAPAVGRYSYDFTYHADIALAAPASINQIEFFYRAVSNPANDLRIFIYDGAWNQVASFNSWAMYGNAIGNLPAKSFSVSSGASPWNNVTRVRVEARGNHFIWFAGAWLPASGYIFEIRAWGPAVIPNVAPNAVIDTPVGDPSIVVGGSVDFTGTGSDSDGVIVANSWTCAAGPGVCPAGFPFGVEDPGIVVFGTVGTYTIEFNVRDDDGAWDPTPDTRTVTVAVAAVVCGDGVIGAGEDCDDGRNDNGDGCSATCQYEVCNYPNLVGYWTFDTGVGNAAHDYSPTGNDGTLTNMDNSNWVSGHIGSWALEFTGGDFSAGIPVADQEYVELLGIEGGPLDGLTAFSVEAWVSFDSASDGDPDADAFVQLNSITYGNANHNVFYLKRGEDNEIDFSSSDNTGLADHLDPPVSLNNGPWYHIVAVWDGSEKIIYVDGAPIGSRAWTPVAIAAVESPLLIGADKDNQAAPDIEDFFDGTIDNVAVFDRALSPVEVLAHFNGGNGESFCAPNPVPAADAGLDQSALSGVAVSVSGACTDDSALADCDWVLPGGCSFVSVPDQTKVGLGTASASSDASVSCVGLPGSIFTLNLTATDDGFAQTPDSMTVTLVAPISVNLFAVESSTVPRTIVEGDSLDSATAVISNFDSAARNVRLVVKLIRELTGAAFRADFVQGPINVPATGSQSVDIEGWIDSDGTSTGTALPVGSYLIDAEIYDSATNISLGRGSSVLVVTTDRSIAVSELDGILLPLIGISVVLMLFFASRKKP